MKETQKKEHTMFSFRAPTSFVVTIKDVAGNLKVSEAELTRRAIEKGLSDAVDEIQKENEEKVKAARKFLKEQKGKFQLNFEFPTMLGASALHDSLCVS